jgi:hypothetical protein
VPRSQDVIEGILAMQIIPKDYPESMFCPRHVSAWCMSKRKRCFDLVLRVAALILFSPMMVPDGLVDQDRIGQAPPQIAREFGCVSRRQAARWIIACASCWQSAFWVPCGYPSIRQQLGPAVLREPRSSPRCLEQIMLSHFHFDIRIP